MEGLKYNNKYFINHIVIVILFFIYNDFNSNIVNSNIEEYCSILPPILYTIPKETLHIIRGNMLGDGSIQYNNISIKSKPKENAKYGMTMDTYSLNYLNHLYENVYGQFSLSGIY